MNERYLNWDTAAQAQLLKLSCAAKLDLVMTPSYTPLLARAHERGHLYRKLRPTASGLCREILVPAFH